MNLFEALVERTLVRSPILLKAVQALEALSKDVKELSAATMALAHQVHSHQQALLELYARQGLVMKAIKSNSLDMRMPDPSDKEKAKPS